MLRGRLKIIRKGRGKPSASTIPSWIVSSPKKCDKCGVKIPGIIWVAICMTTARRWRSLVDRILRHLPVAVDSWLTSFLSMAYNPQKDSVTVPKPRVRVTKLFTLCFYADEGVFQCLEQPPSCNLDTKSPTGITMRNFHPCPS